MMHAVLLFLFRINQVLSFTLNTHFQHCFSKYSYVSFIRCYAYLSLWSIIIGFCRCLSHTNQLWPLEQGSWGISHWNFPTSLRFATKDRAYSCILNFYKIDMWWFSRQQIWRKTTIMRSNLFLKKLYFVSISLLAS